MLRTIQPRLFSLPKCLIKGDKYDDHSNGQIEIRGCGPSSLPNHRDIGGALVLQSTLTHSSVPLHALRIGIWGRWRCTSRACKRTSKTRDTSSCSSRHSHSCLSIAFKHLTSRILSDSCAMPFYCFTRKKTWSGPFPSSNRSTHGSRLGSNLFLIWSKMPDSVPKC